MGEARGRPQEDPQARLPKVLFSMQRSQRRQPLLLLRRPRERERERATTVRLQSELASVTAAAAASEEERAKAERQIERVEAQMEGLKCGEHVEG